MKHLESCESGNKNITNVSISIKEYLRPKNFSNYSKNVERQNYIMRSTVPTQFLGSEVETAGLYLLLVTDRVYK
jgi:hypothetical protein